MVIGLTFAACSAPAPPWPPALPAPPWPPALPPFLIHLPLHGPGPPSLPLIHLRSTSHLKLLNFLWSVWKPLFRGRVMSQSVVGVPSLATRGHSLWVTVCVLNCVSHHPLHLLLVHYCQLVIIDLLASPYKYLVHFVFSCVSIAFCSCVAIFVSCFWSRGLCFLDSENKTANGSFCVSSPWQEHTVNHSA